MRLVLAGIGLAAFAVFTQTQCMMAVAVPRGQP